MFAKNYIKQNYSALNYGSHVARTHVQPVTMHALMVQVFKKYFGTFDQTGCLNEIAKRLADNQTCTPVCIFRFPQDLFYEEQYFIFKED